MRSHLTTLAVIASFGALLSFCGFELCDNLPITSELSFDIRVRAYRLKENVRQEWFPGCYWPDNFKNWPGMGSRSDNLRALLRDDTWKQLSENRLIELLGLPDRTIVNSAQTTLSYCTDRLLPDYAEFFQIRIQNGKVHAYRFTGLYIEGNWQR